MPRSTAAKAAHPQLRQEGPGSNTANQDQPLTKRARTALQGPSPVLETSAGDLGQFEASVGDLGRFRYRGCAWLELVRGEQDGWAWEDFDEGSSAGWEEDDAGDEKGPP